MTKITTTIRAPEEWYKKIDSWAEKHNTSRSGAIVILTKLAMQLLGKLDKKAVERALRG